MEMDVILRYRAALALHLANLLVRAEIVAQLGLDNMPASGAFFSSVDVDTVMRKEPSADCVTPSNPLGLEKGHGIARGEGLDIWAVMEKVKEEESRKVITEETEETEVMKRLNHYKEEHEWEDLGLFGCGAASSWELCTFSGKTSRVCKCFSISGH